MTQTRRTFIRNTCCTAAAMGAASSFSRLGLINALAQGAPDFKALVCIFLFGGNDSNNLLIPNDTTGYGNYANIRKSLASGGLALDQSTLLPITSKTVQVNVNTNAFGLHPSVPELQALFTGGQLAFLANVGTLVKPTTRAQYLAKSQTVPSNLFSHSDQQTQWQTSQPNSFGTTGWAGRIADKIQPIYNVNALFPPITTVAGSAIFCTGQQTQPYAIIPGAALGLSGFGSDAASTARLTALQQLLTFDTGVSLIQSASSITGGSLQNSQTLSAALAASSALASAGGFPTTGVGPQLLQVAKVLKVRSALGLNRQVFFCSLGGFDTHSNQLTLQANLLTGLSQSMNAFYNALVELNLTQQVTTFTMSDFSRTFQPASGGGTDHAWGGVQMIMGGAVLGGDIYGKLPTFALGVGDDSGSNGRWIPTTGLDQYGATLAKWFGVTQLTDQQAIFPNLVNFGATPTLGFLG